MSISKVNKIEKKQWLRPILFILSLFLIINFSRSIYNLWSKGKIVKQYEETLEKAKKEKAGLEEKLKETESEEFIEKQAREKLGLSKEGEMVLILPPITPLPTITPKIEREPIEEWKELFFDRLR